jgi:serine/threonine-protein kinase
LVVHRDIKPGNVLVDRRGQPRLLDFGIAKRLDDSAELTGTQERPRTPAYAAPEQIRGEPVSVATDVYAIGVLLYQALTGGKVWSERGRQLDEAILSSEPGLPSRRVSGSLRRSLEGDLDAIVLQAMQRDPQLRYPSAAAMAADLRAHLAQRPVSARRQRWLYRSQRFALRNRRWVAVALLCVAALATLAARELRHQQLTRLEAQKSDEVARFMLEMFDAGDTLAPEYAISRQSTVMDLMARADARLDELQLAPLVRADLAHKMGQVYWGLSEYVAAERLLQTAVDLRERELGPHDDTAESLLMLGRVHERSTRYPTMLALMQRSHRMRLAILGPDHPNTIHSLHRVGTAHYFLSDLAQAERDLLAAIEAWRMRQPAEPRRLADSLTMQAFIHSDRGRFEQAMPMYEEALALNRIAYPAGHPHLSEGLHNLATCLHDLGRYEAAIELQIEAIAIDEAAFDSDSRALVIDYEWMARHRLAAGQLAQAAAMAEKALAMATRLQARSADAGLLDRARQMQVEVWRAEGRLEEALALQQAVLQSRLQVLPPSHFYLINSHSVLADLLRQHNRTDEASAQLTLALSAWRGQPAIYSKQLLLTLRQFSQSGQCEWLEGDWPSALAPAMAALLTEARERCG